MCSLQGSFGRLRVPLEVNDVVRRADLLEICVRLHNLRARRVGFNQIQTVYMHEWCADGDQLHLWQSFEHILFSDQRKIDRVSRYHVLSQIVIRTLNELICGKTTTETKL